MFKYIYFVGESEKNAIGVYTVEIDETNKKDEEYYLNTTITYSYDSRF